jgi:hypothetical protein
MSFIKEKTTNEIVEIELKKIDDFDLEKFSKLYGNFLVCLAEFYFFWLKRTIFSQVLKNNIHFSSTCHLNNFYSLILWDCLLNAMIGRLENASAIFASIASTILEDFLTENFHSENRVFLEEAEKMLKLKQVNHKKIDQNVIENQLETLVNKTDDWNAKKSKIFKRLLFYTIKKKPFFFSFTISRKRARKHERF